MMQNNDETSGVGESRIDVDSLRTVLKRFGKDWRKFLDTKSVFVRERMKALRARCERYLNQLLPAIESGEDVSGEEIDEMLEDVGSVVMLNEQLAQATGQKIGSLISTDVQDVIAQVLAGDLDSETTIKDLDGAIESNQAVTVALQAARRARAMRDLAESAAIGRTGAMSIVVCMDEAVPNFASAKPDVKLATPGH